MSNAFVNHINFVSYIMAKRDLCVLFISDLQLNLIDNLFDNLYKTSEISKCIFCFIY